MRRPWGVLAVLLLTGVPLQAQTRVAAAPAVVPTYAAPAAAASVHAVPSLSAAPALAPSLAAPLAAPAAL
ncbi:MAG: hypothetical protein HY079_00180, partial [Elusimicrobia bacterium]|nr:hypothetical protein [Elusimicrobiota bacterium]